MIKLPRGNSAAYALKLINSDGSMFIPSADDTVLFTVKQLRKNTADILIQKKIVPMAPYNNMVIVIEPADTINLREGDYYYDVSVCIGGTEFYTAVICDELKLLPTLGDMEALK